MPRQAIPADRAILSDNRPYLALVIVLVLLLASVLVVNAWVVDDAYITFRTVDNFVHGLGLTWNPDERVQVYTHPLWMLVVSFFYFFTSELFFTVIVLSFLLTMSAVLIVWAAATGGFRILRWKGPLLVLALLASKAFIDYASSGLENPLSYLIAALFAVKFLDLTRAGRSVTTKDVSVLILLTSLAFVNRYDTILLYGPAVAWLLWASRSEPKRRLWLGALLSTQPAIAWLLFALVYYGYPYPNTAYAKLICTGFPFSWKLHRGLEYLANSVAWDTASYFALGGAAWLSLRSRSPQAICLLAGIGLYMAYVVVSAASATHMSGRFFAPPFFLAAVLLVYGASNPRFAYVACGLLTVYLLVSPVSPVKFGTSAYQPYAQNPSYIDAKWFVANEGAALINWRPGKEMPDHGWYHYGEWLGKQPERIHVGGAPASSDSPSFLGGEAIGYVAFAAGPNKHFIDPVGLGDPLLARLPAIRPHDMREWKSGHFHRQIPVGYVESLATGKNLIADADVGRYYDLVRTVTRGPVFSLKRFKVIVAMNLGRYQFLLADTNVQAPSTPDSN